MQQRVLAPGQRVCGAFGQTSTGQEPRYITPPSSLLEMGSELIEILQKYVIINIITAILPYFALELLSSTIATCMYQLQ